MNKDVHEKERVASVGCICRLQKYDYSPVVTLIDSLEENSRQ